MGKEGGCKRKRAAVSKQSSSLREEFGLLIPNSDTGQRLAGLLGHCPANPSWGTGLLLTYPVCGIPKG